MEHNLLCPINSDRDLNVYDDYLKECDCEVTEKKPIFKGNSGGYQIMIENKAENMAKRLADTVFMPGYLKTVIGKLVKIETLVGNCLETRVGTLMTVGADYLVIKLYRSCCSMVCESSTVKYVTVIHDNDINKIGPF